MKTRDKILKAVRASDVPLSVREIAEHVLKGVATVHQHICNLEADGLLKRVGQRRQIVAVQRLSAFDGRESLFSRVRELVGGGHTGDFRIEFAEDCDCETWSECRCDHADVHQVVVTRSQARDIYESLGEFFEGEYDG